MILENTVSKSNVFLQSDLWKALVSKAFSQHKSVHPSTIEPWLGLRSPSTRDSQEVIIIIMFKNIILPKQ